MGIAQKAEKDPQDCIFGDSCKRQKVIPKDVLKENVVKPYVQRGYDEEINLGETSGNMWTDNCDVWGATAI